MYLAKLSDAPTLLAGKLSFHPLAVPSRGSKELTVWNVELPAGVGSGPHSLDHEQIVVVGEGVVTLHIEGEQVAAGPGDALILPAATLLELSNAGSLPASAIVISPVGFKASAGGHSFTPPWSL